MFYLTVPYLVHSLELWIDLNLGLLLAFLLCINPRVFIRLLHEYFETPIRDPLFFQAWFDEWVLSDTGEENDTVENT